MIWLFWSKEISKTSQYTKLKKPVSLKYFEISTNFETSAHFQASIFITTFKVAKLKFQHWSPLTFNGPLKAPLPWQTPQCCLPPLTASSALSWSGGGRNAMPWRATANLLVPRRQKRAPERPITEQVIIKLVCAWWKRIPFAVLWFVALRFL